MFVENLSQPELITKPAILTGFADGLSRESILAVDTESNSLFAYREQVCLIQFSTQQVDTLVDPLALRDLSPLAPIFSNAQIEKVFHAAEYDILCLKRDFGFTFANLFDTMLAARILGRKEVGLGSMLDAEFGVVLDKRYQRADWGQRPLPRPYINYARLDTHYLIALRDRLQAELEETDRWLLAVEDFARLCKINGRTPETEEASCLHMSGANDLTAQQAAVLQELCRYRDQIASSLNRPRFKVIGNDTLVAIAAACPANMGDLSRLPGMSPHQLSRHGSALLQAIQRGLHATPIYPVRNPRPDEDYLGRLEALRQWRKNTALSIGVESDVVLPRDLMYELAVQNPRQEADSGRSSPRCSLAIRTFRKPDPENFY